MGNFSILKVTYSTFLALVIKLPSHQEGKVASWGQNNKQTKTDGGGAQIYIVPCRLCL